MPRNLSAVTLNAPAAPVAQDQGTTFTFTAAFTFTGSGAVNAYDVKFEVNPGSGFVTIPAASQVLTTADANPSTNRTATTNLSITVTCATSGGPYTIRISGAPATGGAYTLTSGTQTVTVRATAAAAGVATVSGVGVAGISGVASSAGVGSAAAVSAVDAASVANASGAGTGAAIGDFSTAGGSRATRTELSGIGGAGIGLASIGGIRSLASSASGAASAAGTSTVTGISAVAADSSASSSGVATVAGVSAAAADSIALSAGVSTAAAVGSSTGGGARATRRELAGIGGAGIGLASIGGIRSLAASGTAVASASGAATVTGVSAVSAASVASASGVATADAVGSSTTAGSVAAAAGTSTVTGVSSALAASTALAAGAATANAIGSSTGGAVVTPPSIGGGGFIAHRGEPISRKRLERILREILDAEEQARKLKSKTAEKRLVQTRRFIEEAALSEALDYALAAETSARIAKLETALKGAAHAKQVSTVLSQTAMAVRVAAQIKEQLDDDDEAITLLLVA